MVTLMSLWLGFVFIELCHCFDSIICKEGEVTSLNGCIPCKDDQCRVCSNDKSGSCMQCKIGFELVLNKCGNNCTHFNYCDICSIDLTQCLHCTSKCSLSNGKCSCVSKIVIIVVCVIISLLIIGVIIYCLTKPIKFVGNEIDLKLRKTNNAIRDQHQMNQRQQETVQINDNFESLQSYRTDKIQIEDLFNINKIKIGQITDKQLCDKCKEQNGNVKLSCGCFLCNEHSMPFEKSNETIKNCPVCDKKVESLINITCGICFQNKSVLSRFPCLCSLLICIECFAHTIRTTRSCPACRAII